MILQSLAFLGAPGRWVQFLSVPIADAILWTFKMHMFMWLGYNLGEFMFEGLNIATKSAFAGTCILLFVIAFLFEGSKLYVARTQRAATKRLCRHRRSDERRNLLWDTRPESQDAGTSRTAANAPQTVSRTIRILINTHQTSLYLLHNTVGYLLMMAVMVYNAYLVVAVVLGMMAGYFVFGPMLTQLQMECPTKTGPHCTHECDENAEGTTPPLLHTSLSSESDFFACHTPSCSRPGDSSPAAAPDPHLSSTKNCYHGAKRCPSKVAVVTRLQNEAGRSSCHMKPELSDVGESQNIEDTMLLRDGSPSCCASTPPPSVALEPVVRIVDAQSSLCTRQESGTDEDISMAHHTAGREGSQSPTGEEKCGDSRHDVREESPQVSCCHNTKPIASDSQENIL